MEGVINSILKTTHPVDQSFIDDLDGLERKNVIQAFIYDLLCKISWYILIKRTF